MAYAGSGLAYTGGSKAYSFVRNKLDNTFNNQNIHEEEINSEGSEISFSQTDKDFKEDENYTEPEDFSINEKEDNPRIENRNETNLSLEEKTHQDISTEQTINQENNISKENNIKTTKDFHIENSPQVTQVKEPQNISQSENFNESILEKPRSEDLSHEEPIKETNQKIFDKDIHNLDFEEGGKLHRPPPPPKK